MAKKDDKYVRDVVPGGNPPKKNQITFILKVGLTAKTVKSTIKNIRSWPEIKSVGQIFKGMDLDATGKPDPQWLRYYSAYVKKEEQIEQVVKKLKSLPQVESAYLPPDRNFRR